MHHAHQAVLVHDRKERLLAVRRDHRHGRVLRQRVAQRTTRVGGVRADLIDGRERRGARSAHNREADRLDHWQQLGFVLLVRHRLHCRNVRHAVVRKDDGRVRALDAKVQQLRATIDALAAIEQRQRQRIDVKRLLGHRRLGHALARHKL